MTKTVKCAKIYGDFCGGGVMMLNGPVSFYTEDGKVQLYRVNNHFASGACADIYKIDYDTCLKWVYHASLVRVDVLKTIRDLTLDSFYQIYDLLYNKHKLFSGYTMKYYEDNDINIMEMPVEYTLSNLYRLYDSFIKLTDKSIMADDLHSGNAVLGKKNITIIDADMYYFYNNKGSLWEKNYIALLNLFRQIYYDGLLEYDYSTSTINEITESLFNYREGIDIVEKKLIRYKKPIDYVKDNGYEKVF